MSLKRIIPGFSVALRSLLTATRYTALLLPAVIAGLAVVLLPPGLMVRAFAVFGVLAFLTFAWAYPALPKRNPPYWKLSFLASLVLLLANVWPQYVFLGVGSLPRVNPFTLGSFLLLAFFAVVALHYRQFLSEFRLTSVRGLLMVYALWMAWRVFTAAIVDFPVARIIEIFREFVFIHSAFFVALVLSIRVGWKSRISNILIFAALIVASAGILEAIELKNRFVTFASTDEAGQLGSVIAGIASEKVRSGAFRVQSVFGHPILFGQFLGAIVPLILAAFFVKRSLMWRSLMTVVVALCVVGIWKSGSRSGVLALVVSLTIFALLIWWRVVRYSHVHRGAAIALVPVIVLGAAAGALVVQDLVRGNSQNEASSSSTRLIQINSAVSAALDSPIVGYGQSSALGLAGVAAGNGVLTMDIHYISLLLDSGFVGAALFAVLAIGVVSGLVAHSVDEDVTRGLFACSIVAACLSVLVTLAGVAIPQNLYLFFLGFGCLVGLNREKNESRED